MSPRYLRYRFPGDHGETSAATPEEHARALAHLFGRVPPAELSIGRLDNIAGRWAHDPGALDMTFGEDLGEELSSWLRLVVGPGGKVAYLDVDLDVLGRTIRDAKAR